MNRSHQMSNGKRRSNVSLTQADKNKRNALERIINHIREQEKKKSIIPKTYRPVLKYEENVKQLPPGFTGYYDIDKSIIMDIIDVDDLISIYETSSWLANIIEDPDVIKN